MDDRSSADEFPTIAGGSAERRVRPADLAHLQPFLIGEAEVRPASLQVACGDLQEALEPRVMQVLGPALAGGGSSLVSLAGADRNLDPIRDDPRFKKMLADAKQRLAAN